MSHQAAKIEVENNTICTLPLHGRINSSTLWVGRHDEVIDKIDEKWGVLRLAVEWSLYKSCRTRLISAAVEIGIKLGVGGDWEVP